METILFRASGVGALQVDGRGTVLTENQLKKLEEYKTKIRNSVKLTPNQAEEFKSFSERAKAPVQLSETAKQFVQDTWLLNEKGFYQELKNPYVDKGVFGEEIGMSLLSEIDNNFYKKNTQRIVKGNLTGECDNKFTQNGKKIVQDLKLCWNPKTFMNSEISKLYEWQGRTYLDLYDADEFWLRYALIDCPDHLVAKEKEKIWRQYYDNSMSDSEAQILEERLKPLFDQVDMNLVYCNNPRYTPEERVKTFKITRDDALFKTLLDRIPGAIDHYKSIKLNSL